MDSPGYRNATARLQDFIQRRRIQAMCSAHGVKPTEAGAFRQVERQLTEFLARGIMSESPAKPPPVRYETTALGFTHARVDVVVTTPEELFELVMLAAKDLAIYSDRPIIFDYKDQEP